MTRPAEGHVASCYLPPVSLPRGSGSWIQGGKGLPVRGGVHQIPSYSPGGGPRDSARGRGIIPRERTTGLLASSVSTSLPLRERPSSIGCAAALGGISLELGLGSGGQREEGDASSRESLHHHSSPSWTGRRTGRAAGCRGAAAQVFSTHLRHTNPTFSGTRHARARVKSHGPVPPRAKPHSVTMNTRLCNPPSA